MEKQERSHGIMEATDSVDTKQSKQRASIKWLLSKAYNNRVPENLLEPFYRDHEDQEHLKPPIIGRLASAELYCLALANMYSDPNYHSLNHWNILTTLSRKGVHVQDPTDCALTETVLIQTNPLKLSAHMSVIEALMVLYAREVGTLDRVSAAAQRFGTSQQMQLGSTVPHEDGLICWINAACSAFNKAEENTSQHVSTVTSLQEVCDGTALAALISFYCPDALNRSEIRLSRAASLHDCLHNLMLVYEFCRTCLPHQVFHMMPEDVAYMRGSMRQNLIVMLADLFNMLEVHPVKCVKYPGSVSEQSNEHGIRHKRCLPPPPPAAIPDLRPDDVGALPFQVPRSPSACAVRPRVPTGRSACSTPERRSCSPQREEFVVHRGRAVTTLAAVVRRDDDNASGDPNKTAAGRPSNWNDSRDTFAGRRSRRSSISDDSQLTVENFGGSQDRLHFAGKNPEKELATLANVRKISAPAGPIDHNPPVRSSQQDIRGSFQFFHGDYQNGSSQEKPQKVDRQTPQPQTVEPTPFYPIKRQMSSDLITMNKDFGNAGGDGGFYLNRDAPDGEMGNKITFSDVNRTKNNGDNMGLQKYRDIDESEIRRKSNASTPNITTWQQQFMQHPQQHQHNGEGDRLSSEESSALSSGQATAAQLHAVRMKLEEKRRRMEMDKRKMELALTRQRQHVGQQAFLQAVARGKRPARDGEHTETAHPVSAEISPDLIEHNVPGRRSPEIDTVALEQYQQSIAKMNTNIQDIQTDIARLANQQNQLSQQQPMAGLPSHPPHYQPAPPSSPYQPPYQPNIPHLHSQFSSQHNVSSPRPNPLNNSNFGSTPHIPREFQPQYYRESHQNYHDPHQNYHDPHQNYEQQPKYHEKHQHYHEQQPSYHEKPQKYHDKHQNYHDQQQNYHDQQQNYHDQQQNYHDQQQNYHEQQGFGNQRQFFLHENPTSQRRTWAQHAQMSQHNDNPELRGWQIHQQPNHQSPQYQPPHDPQPQMCWKSPPSNSAPSAPSGWQPQGFVLHERPNGNDAHLSYTVINPSQTPPAHSSSPQRRSKTPQRQGSLPETPRRTDHVSLQQLQAPAVDDMEPQNISFIGNAEDDSIRQGINRLNISSGTRTYRIPSPTRPSLSRNSFQHPEPEEEPAEKGFYISFDNEQPKRPKPPLRAKRGSPKKDRTPSSNPSPERKNSDPWNDNERFAQEEEFVVQRNVPTESGVRSHDVSERRETPPRDKPTQRPNKAEPAALVIGDVNPDPNSAEEMERKKERIMLLSLQRRQRGEEARAQAEQAAAARRARHERDAELRAARRDAQAQRRDAILAQYKLKRAREEAEREGKVLDTSEFMESLKGVPQPPPPARVRNKPATSRARPKTIHVDSGALHAAEGIINTSKQPSSTNLTATGSMRRDYYRGSQDSLADRANVYAADSPVDDRGAMSPSSGSGSGPLGRRGSCKTSRERVTEDVGRGRSKYSTYQGQFKAGRKSSSLMNLCDSGLGRATPPRRAASPGGLGASRGMVSPASGPGSLPGGVGKRRQPHQDDHSDVSSTHSSILDYSGPRLYKQPASKSNRGLMQNAIEHCVFPGAVNAAAARRLLAEMARADYNHFLVLFRDAACQFRALYSYCPDTDTVTKLYGTGPKNVTERMFDKFFKYNSGSKSFSQVHTKHLTVTIDAFTIHNALWQGKKVQLPSKKDMALVI